MCSEDFACLEIGCVESITLFISELSFWRCKLLKNDGSKDPYGALEPSKNKEDRFRKKRHLFTFTSWIKDRIVHMPTEIWASCTLANFGTRISVATHILEPMRQGEFTSKKFLFYATSRNNEFALAKYACVQGVLLSLRVASWPFWNSFPEIKWFGHLVFLSWRK